MKIYNVNNIESTKLIITGKGDNEFWSKAEILKDFHSPWYDINKTKTEFRALWDDKHLFFLFKVLDDTVHVDVTNNSFKSINVSDRIELFFRTDDSLNPYYCLEIDPTPRIMDFKALPNKKFDFDWNWPKKDLVVKSFLFYNGFSVEGKISIASLKKLNLIHDNKIETGLFRAKYFKTKKSDYQPIWITWVNPKTETPNFHISSSFGVLKLR
jgi:hypothetical protein